jgi:hypothetical protein
VLQDEALATKGCEVYVTRVPRDLMEKDLHTVFSRQEDIMINTMRVS